MKLTQKTLFQCFEKSRPQSSISTPPAESSPCKSLIKTSDPQPDFLAPIHIRQSDNSLSTNTIPLFHESNLNNDSFSYCNQEFYRICPTIINDEFHLPKIQFNEISSIERQAELFLEYTKDQTLIDWKSIFDGLQDYRKKAIEQNQYEQLLWTDIYRPKSSQTYLGNHTQQIKRLNQWFSYWTMKLHNDQPKPKKRKRISDDDFDDDENSSMSCNIKPEHPQLIFIHGTGTTSLVHALAEEHNFKITEINGSQSRARAPLLKQLEQVTSHHHLSFKRCPSDTIASQEDRCNVLSPLPPKKKIKNEHNSIKSYFKKPDKNNNDYDDEQKENRFNKKLSQIKLEETSIITADNYLFSSVQVEKTSLILFDEIETLTTDDNFWSCLKKLLETAKKPIILTSNSRTNPEEAIINLSKIGYYELIHLESHEIEYICCFLRLILLTEMIEVSLSDDLSSLFQSCSSDLRQTLLILQFLAQSSIGNNLPQHTSDETISVNSKSKFQSSRIFDAMYYSYLNEQWNESILKTYFDDLTKRHTSQYETSHQLLLNQNKNNTQRIELYDTFKLFMQEQDIVNITDHPSFYLDYRPYIRQICQNEQIRANQSDSNRRLRHNLHFRGCTLRWSDFEILSAGIN